jgi:translocation and assembly module TamA
MSDFRPGCHLRPTPLRICTKRFTQLARLSAATAVLAVFLTAVPARAAEGVKVEVVVEGLPAEMKRNVLGSMMLAAAAGEGKLSEGEARRLAARAPQEIEQALQPFGYYRPVIQDELVHQGGSWKARYKVELGAPLLISSVDVQVTGAGAELPKCRQLVRDFPLKPGDRLQHAPYDALKAGFSQTAAQNGYLDATFIKREIAVDLKEYSARIEVHFETGARYFFGPVRFEQDVLDSAFVRSFVTFETGEPYDTDSLIAMQNALGSSPYFSRVEVEPRRDQATDLRVPIDVRLEPAKPLRYTLGGGYGTDTGAQAEASLEFRRLNRKGHRATARVLASERRNEVSLQYQVPRALGRRQLLSYSIALVDEETDAQRTRGGSVGVALLRDRAGWQESFGLFFQRQSFTVGQDEGTPDLFFPEMSWSHVRSDDRLDPRKGHRIVFLGRAASDQVLSDVSFGQLNVQSKLIWSPRQRERLIARAEAGATRTDDFHELPPGIRYFAGGAQSVRAFGYQDLGPRDANGEPLGGERLLFGSLEYERRLFGAWGVAGFYDIGNALESFGDPLEDGAGVGARWSSPVGMIRLDVAWPLHDSPRGQLQFSMGPDL